MKYAHIITEACETPWALFEEKLQAIGVFLSTKAMGGDVDVAEIKAMTEAAGARANPRGAGMVAVLPLLGTLFPRANMMTEFSGGTSLSQWIGQFRALVNDPGVKAIVIDVHSPGGSTYGVDEVSSEVFAARAAKPIVAVSNAMMASAAYYIGSAATEVVASPSSLTGSIGVYMLHLDQSKANEVQGITPTYISAGKDKVLGNEDGPLSPEGASYLQGIVNDAYRMFTNAVARNRGVKAGDVRDGFGEGRILTATDALKGGLVDRIATLDETIARFAGSGGATGARSAARERELAIARA